VHASDYEESVRFYETVLAPLGEPGFREYAPGYYAAYLLDPDGNNIEALYRDVGNIGRQPAA
jgi:hypothetical protein